MEAAVLESSRWRTGDAGRRTGGVARRARINFLATSDCGALGLPSRQPAGEIPRPVELDDRGPSIGKADRDGEASPAARLSKQRNLGSVFQARPVAQRRTSRRRWRWCGDAPAPAVKRAFTRPPRLKMRVSAFICVHLRLITLRFADSSRQPKQPEAARRSAALQLHASSRRPKVAIGYSRRPKVGGAVYENPQTPRHSAPPQVLSFVATTKGSHRLPRPHPSRPHQRLALLASLPPIQAHPLHRDTAV